MDNKGRAKCPCCLTEKRKNNKTPTPLSWQKKGTSQWTWNSGINGPWSPREERGGQSLRALEHPGSKVEHPVLKMPTFTAEPQAGSWDIWGASGRNARVGGREVVSSFSNAETCDTWESRAQCAWRLTLWQEGWMWCWWPALCQAPPQVLWGHCHKGPGTVLKEFAVGWGSETYCAFRAEGEAGFTCLRISWKVSWGRWV